MVTPEQAAGICEAQLSVAFGKLSSKPLLTTLRPGHAKPALYGDRERLAKDRRISGHRGFLEQVGA